MPAPLTRALLVFCLLLGGTAGAEVWKQVRPGATTEQQVLSRFGEPTRRHTAGGERVLTYDEDSAPAGTVRADFHVDARTQRLRRLDVYPSPAPSRDAVERMFGPACQGAGRSKKPCHEVRLSATNEPYLHYVSRGLAVFFSRGELQALTYLPAARTRQARVAPVEPPLMQEAPAASPEPRASTSADDEGLAQVTPTPASLTPSKPSVAVEPIATSPVVPELAVARVEAPGSDTGASATRVEAPGPDTGTSASDLLRPAMMDGAGGAPSPTADSDTTQGPRPLNEPDETRAPRLADPVQPEVLTLGGFYFQRADMVVSRRATDDATAAQPYFPGLVDVYLDFRPQDEIRAYVVGRLVYDPLDPAFSTPKTSLDKLWVYFGLFDSIYVTAGRQHVKWGSSRIWNTTDFLRSPNPDPLGVFDLRQGVDMVKVNVPFESLRANLWAYATATLEDTGVTGALPRARYGGAVRGDIAFGTSELIASASFLERRRPRYGLDYSLGIGRLDLNAEVAFVRDSDTRLWRATPEGFVERTVTGTQVQASAGVAAELRMGDLYRTVLRAEGFYNQLGDDDRRLLTWVQSTGDYRALYFGRTYGLGQITVTRRSIYEPSWTLTVLGNLGDPSFLGRLDFGFVRNNVNVAAFVEAPFGARGGEFRFQPDPTVAELPATDLGMFRAGMSLRLRL